MDIPTTMQKNFRTQYLLTQYYKVTPMIRGWNTTHEKRLRELGLFSGKRFPKALGEPNSLPESKRRLPRRLFTETHGGKTRDNGYKLKQGQF